MAFKVNYDCCGYVTKNDLKCSDGRTIRRDAFKHNDGMTVPVVWQHQHDDPTNVLGKALLENRDDGVFGYIMFNNTFKGQNAKELVEHGDITSFSIWANKLTQKNGDVFHGDIKEVSLVLSGANPGARIELMHSDIDGEEGAILFNNSVAECVPGVIELYEQDDDYVSHTDDDSDDDDDETVQDVFDSLTDKQKKVVMYIINEAVANATSKSGSDDVKHSDEGGNDDMRTNVFDNTKGSDYIAHADELRADFSAIMADARKNGSVKDSVLEHAATYGIEDIEWLFPEAKNLNNTPEFIKRDDSWVSVFMSKTTKSPFSRIKSQFADITADAARAKGYTKGKKKLEEIFTLLKRTTTPTTIYKKQKIDRDDVIDITSFDVIVWIKGEMKIMYLEEIARAALIGDGRAASSDDKIKEDCIRPILTDDDLFTIKYDVALPNNATDGDKVDAFIDACVLARDGYEGSGSPILFTTDTWVSKMLIRKDNVGHRLYKDVKELATAMLVSEIVTVPVMKGLTRTATVQGKEKTYDVYGIIVNPKDYTFGSDKGGQMSFFEDFDINYNQQIYLYEGRCSGALIKPKSAIVLEVEQEVEKPAG